MPEPGPSLDRPAATPSARDTEALAGFLVATRYDDLPPAVVERLTWLAIDAVGCIVGGLELEPSRVLLDYLAAQGGAAQATILGTRLRLPTVRVAQAHAALGNTLDFDDTLHGHPGATIVGPGLALAEHHRLSGRRLLTALAVAYEVSLRVSAATAPTADRWRQVASSATPQTFGAAAVTAKLLDLDQERTQMAFGLAGASAPVPAIRKFGTREGGRISWAKNNYATAAASGVQAGELAARGFIGPTSILDGERGFWVMAGSDRYQPEHLHLDLGEFTHLRQVAFKPYPCCRFFHAALDALDQLLTTHQLSAADLRALRVHALAHHATFLNRRPQHPFDAEFSLPYALAMTALRHPPGRAWFHPGQLTDPQVARLMQLVEVEIDPDAEARFRAGRPYPTRVTVTLADGRTLAASVTQPRGHPDNPLPTAALADKFLELTRPALGPELGARWLDALQTLDRSPDVSQLLTPPAAA